MKLNFLEFYMMNNPLRALAQARYEMPLLKSIMPSFQAGKVLEIGCGNGYGTMLIKKHFQPEEIVAIDMDERMIQRAQKRNTERGTTFQLMNATDLDFPNDSFDAVFDFGIIHHIPNWKDCLEEVKRVLKPGGIFLLEELSTDSFETFSGKILKQLTDHPYEQMFSVEEFQKQLKNIGFTINGFKQQNPLGLVKFFSICAILE